MSERRETQVLSLYPQALDAFGHLVRRVAPHQWAAPTPCTEWAVRDVVNHLTAEQLWVPELLMGSTVAEVGGRFDGDVLDEDPGGAWQAAADAAKEAFLVPGAEDVTVHLSYGDVPALAYCDQMTVDAVVHTWDLARGISADPGLSPELVDFALAEVSGYGEGLAASGLFAPPVEVPADASALTRLLGLTGRRAQAPGA
ncbi:TIGR03086 family metal-binding protein [Kitasatospora sp. NPDC057223]|uniref:TIGR03086 family metal-binding protein n=1 Tax=Kitasatospora sp. NPDC057223 TaxID=3346055 RepID=UPI003632FAEA